MAANKNNYRSISLHRITYKLIQDLGPKMGLHPVSSVPRIITILAENKDWEVIFFEMQMAEQ